MGVTLTLWPIPSLTRMPGLRPRSGPLVSLFR